MSEANVIRISIKLEDWKSLVPKLQNCRIIVQIPTVRDWVLFIKDVTNIKFGQFYKLFYTTPDDLNDMAQYLQDQGYKDIVILEVQYD